ncbi:uncharacterized protein LOC106056009 isoform X1 [Biomphalaria glabrata]|uniref:Uncharacterized protein LOC106056009 isoform X1 n=2 Tax=Biomphalaria glabrata TaxID=6526 RepID=A0A9W2ZC69_BIOGL|nr:uncharacterized protein LOC106056009 isoform X1 [Biomphalaria glabrata]
MEIAMCDNLPATEDPPENYFIDNALRNVGQIVTVYCKNTTVAVLKCLPDLKWNATVPACPSSNQTKDSLSEMLIIVWVVGAILLLALIILIVIIVRSRSKNGCRPRSPTSSPSSIFHITSHRREGGDNPAFSRADERCGEWSFHRAADLRDSTRLPSYQEAILNHYITVPARAGNLNPDRSNFNRASAPPSYRTSQHHNQPINASENRSADSTAQSENRNTPVDPPAENPNNTNSTNAQTDTVQANRYAENYPQCFFEEEPPPPYTPGPSNTNMYRSPSRQSHPQRGGFTRRNLLGAGARSRLPPRRDTNQRTNAGVNVQERNTQANHEATQTLHNVPYDTMATLAVPNRRQSIHTNSSSVNSVSANPVTSQGSKTDIVNCSVPSSLAAERTSNTVDNGNSNRHEQCSRSIVENNSGQSQHEPLYVMRSTKPSSEGYNFYPAHSSLTLPSHPYAAESHPIGTSTPIHQSPAVARRFVPDDRPSPLPIPRQFHPTGYNSQPEQYIFYMGSSSTNGVLQPASQNCPYPAQIRNHSAPLARLEVEYF